MTLDGKVALVTGAATGIGRAVAIAYANAGAKVVVSDIDDTRGQETVDQITGAGGEATYFHCDTSSAEQNDALVDHAKQTFGRLDLACNNAGVGPAPLGLADFDDDEWRRIIAINLDGVFYGMRAQIKAMLESGGGVIVNIASILGQVAFPGAAPYVAAKHGVVGLTKQAALEYAASGIRTIAIGPGFIETDILKNLDDEGRAGLVALHPAGRIGQPPEIGEVVAAVSADSWSFANGAYIPVDGGYLSR